MLRRCLTHFDRVRITECPRDAIQSLPFIATHQKVAYLKKLLACNFDALDCVSFVPPKIMPQFADTEDVLKEIGPCNDDNRQRSGHETLLLAVVANLRGAASAISNEHISVIGYPLSASETFQQRNTRRSIAEALSDIKDIQAAVVAANSQSGAAGQQTPTKRNKQLGVCISMAFGAPASYGEQITAKEVSALCLQLYDMGVPLIYFADTVGLGTAEHIAETFSQATSPILVKDKSFPFGIHLHSHPSVAEKKVRLCIEAGCRRFDGAISGMGGCPFAMDDLVGNIPSETIMKVVDAMEGVVHGVSWARHAEAKEALLQMVPGLGRKPSMT